MAILPKAQTRSRSAGIVFMGMGAALMFLIGFAGGEPGAAIGVGGAIIIIGLNIPGQRPDERQPRPANLRTVRSTSTDTTRSKHPRGVPT